MSCLQVIPVSRGYACGRYIYDYPPLIRPVYSGGKGPFTSELQKFAVLCECGQQSRDIKNTDEGVRMEASASILKPNGSYHRNSFLIFFVPR